MPLEKSYPKVIVFDLDYTLWPFWCDTHLYPPVRAAKNGAEVYDKSGEYYSLYKDVPDILVECRNLPVTVCIASRTHAPKIAKDLLRLFIVDGESMGNYITHSAWGTASKVGHLKELSKLTGVDPKDMILFDDESRNRDVEDKLGATFMEVRSGLKKGVFENGLEKWRKNQKTR